MSSSGWSDRKVWLIGGAALAVGALGLGVGISYSRFRQLQKKALEGEGKTGKKKRAKKVKVLSEDEVADKLQAGLDSLNQSGPGAPATPEQTAAVELALRLSPNDFSPHVRLTAAKVLFTHHMIASMASPAGGAQAERVQAAVRRLKDYAAKVLALLDMDDSGLDERQQEEAIALQIEMALPMHDLHALARALDKCRALVAVRPFMAPSMQVWFLKASFVFGQLDEYLRAYKLVFGSSRQAREELEALHMGGLEAPELLQADHLVLAELITKKDLAAKFTPPPPHELKAAKFLIREMKSSVNKYVDVTKTPETVQSLREQMNAAGASWKPIEGGIVMRVIGCYANTRALSPSQMPVFGFKNDTQLFLANWADSINPTTQQTSRMYEEYELRYVSTEPDTGFQIWEGTYRMRHDLKHRLEAEVPGYTPRTELILDIAVKIQPAGPLQPSLADLGIEVTDTSGLSAANGVPPSIPVD